MAADERADDVRVGVNNKVAANERADDVRVINENEVAADECVNNVRIVVAADVIRVARREDFLTASGKPP